MWYRLDLETYTICRMVSQTCRLTVTPFNNYCIALCSGTSVLVSALINTTRRRGQLCHPRPHTDEIRVRRGKHAHELKNPSTLQITLCIPCSISMIQLARSHPQKRPGICHTLQYNSRLRKRVPTVSVSVRRIHKQHTLLTQKIRMFERSSTAAMCH